MKSLRSRALPLLILLAGALPGSLACARGNLTGEGDPKPREVAPPTDLTPDERLTIDVFDKASRSVVFITTAALRRDFWTMNVFEVPQGSGSGFVWDKEGHIVTNYHVIAGASSITVVPEDRKEHKATVVGRDQDHDLAVLLIKAPPESLVPTPIGSSEKLRVGQKVLAIGNPFGLDHTLTTGVVSALGRAIQSMSQRTIEGVIQTDAAINPGNSGGPLLDSAGRLIGVNTQIVSPSGASAGIGFAVPVDTVNRIVPQLIAYGKMIRPGLGIRSVNDSLARRWGIKGVAIYDVTRGGAAAGAGLRGVRELESGEILLGDVIVAVDGKPVESLDDLLDILDQHKVGDEVTVEYLRDEAKKQTSVTLQQV